MWGLADVLSGGAGFVLCFLYASLFEYAFHRWLLHRSSRWVSQPYQTHVFLHHGVFGGDASYHVQRDEHRGAILFEWWQAPVLLAGHAPVAWGLEAISGLPVFWPAMTALAVYYILYEYLHWCMHNPGRHRLAQTRLFHYLDAHHRLHHGQWGVNFNVLLPLGDLLFGTLRREGPGEAVPGIGARS
jgi:hypothetical protein